MGEKNIVPSLYVTTSAKNDWGHFLRLDTYRTGREFIDACRILHHDEENPTFIFKKVRGVPKRFYSRNYISGELWEWLCLSEYDRFLIKEFESYYCSFENVDDLITWVNYVKIDVYHSFEEIVHEWVFDRYFYNVDPVEFIAPFLNRQKCHKELAKQGVLATRNSVVFCEKRGLDAVRDRNAIRINKRFEKILAKDKAEDLDVATNEVELVAAE